MTYKVQLDIFEGPLDLLLFFIQRDEIDIYDIPIATITDSYLGYIDLMRQMNIGIAGEYIRMAATLMRVKARTLLPQLSESDDDEEIEDPRSELVQMLLEYKQYKEISQDLKEWESEQIMHFHRQPDLSHIDTDVTPEEVLHDVSLFDLMKTFQRLISNIPETPVHRIHRYDVTIQKQSEYLLSKFNEAGEVYFSEVMQDIGEKLTLIVTFIAILDMIKNQKILVFQSDTFDDFRMELRTEVAEVE